MHMLFTGMRAQSYILRIEGRQVSALMGTYYEGDHTITQAMTIQGVNCWQQELPSSNTIPTVQEESE